MGSWDFQVPSVSEKFGWLGDQRGVATTKNKQEIAKMFGEGHSLSQSIKCLVESGWYSFIKCEG